MGIERSGPRRVWDDYITPRDRKVFEAAGYGSYLGPGRKPAVLVVDVSYGFVGHESAPILESIATWPNSCGEEGWAAVGNISTLLEQARSKGVPVIYTTGMPRRADGLGRQPWRTDREVDASTSNGVDEYAIVDKIQPLEGEIVIAKYGASAFFQTSLLSYLMQAGVDTLLIVGTTTSGCVKASVIDAFQHSYRVLVVEECTFDRGQASHAVSLFDMNAKYADVVTLASALDYLDSAEAESLADAL